MSDNTPRPDPAEDLWTDFWPKAQALADRRDADARAALREGSDPAPPTEPAGD